MKIVDNTHEIVNIDDLICGATFKRINEKYFGYFMKINPNGCGCGEYNAIDLINGSLCRIEDDEILMVVDCKLIVE